MLDYWVTTMVEITISTSFIIVLLLLLRPFTGKKYEVKWRYWLWLAVALRLLVPINITLPQAPIQIDSPVINTNSAPVISKEIVLSPHETTGLDQIAATAAEQSMSVQHIAAFVWFTGMTLVLTYHSIGHFLFLSRTRRWGKPVTEPRILEQYRQMMKQLSIKRNVKLKISKSIKSPMLTGLAKPTVWLPAASYSQEELQVIFKHELIHFKQRHLWYKLVMLCTQAVHWFNPFVYFMVKEANKHVEIVCDSEVVRGTNVAFKKQYSEVILTMMNHRTSRTTTLSTHFNGGKKMMKQRLAGIFDTRKKGRGIGAILLVGLLLSLAGGLAACSKEASDPETTPVESNSNSPSNNNTVVPALGTDGQQEPVPNNSGVSAEKDDFLASEEGKAFEAAAQQFTQAFLSNDRATMRELIIEPDSQQNYYVQETLWDNVESMTLKLSSENIKGNAISAQYEIHYKDKDSFQYVDLQMKKVNEEWKVESYGLEQ
ncbi:M56 family metallopeptidase [Paenibacillus sp. S150]|uniref:M56 family metallopeptidase n=1 Tax=Paenibacillus sp. S150 TaxID=2749826 RepID=UPI001C5780C5|nr:M56 family metallopeptidase [Paenibacillus sp. S150]MBW4079943.1 M56 family metallopeptidase [Paenibacillus sp. S150]